MRITVICDKAFEVSETFIFNEISFLTATNIHLITRKRLNRKLYKLPSKVRVSTWYNSLWFRLFFKLEKAPYRFPKKVDEKLRKIIIKTKPEIIIAHYGPAGLKVLDIAKDLHIPLIVRFHGYDASRLLSNKDYVNRLKGLFEYAHVSTPSRFLANQLIRNGLDRKRNTIIPYGVDFDLFPDIKTYRAVGDVIILHGGRLVEKKGVYDLLRAFKALSGKMDGIKLVIAGGGDQFEVLNTYVKDNDLLDDVIFTGPVSQSKMIQLMYSSDIFVLNSRTSSQDETEGYPVAILEAMACGLPIISTIHAGIPDQIDDGKNGLLIEERNTRQLTNALYKLIKEPIYRQQLGEAARKKATRKFDYSHLQEAYDKYFESILET